MGTHRIDPKDLPPFVLVEWDDAWTEYEPVLRSQLKEEVAQPWWTYDCGFLLEEDEEQIVLARTYYRTKGDEDTEEVVKYSGRIPRGMIKRIIRLKS